MATKPPDEVLTRLLLLPDSSAVFEERDFLFEVTAGVGTEGGSCGGASELMSRTAPDVEGWGVDMVAFCSFSALGVTSSVEGPGVVGAEAEEEELRLTLLGRRHNIDRFNEFGPYLVVHQLSTKVFEKLYAQISPYCLESTKPWQPVSEVNGKW